MKYINTYKLFERKETIINLIEHLFDEFEKKYDMDIFILKYDPNLVNGELGFIFKYANNEIWITGYLKPDMPADVNILKVKESELSKIYNNMKETTLDDMLYNLINVYSDDYECEYSYTTQIEDYGIKLLKLGAYSDKFIEQIISNKERFEKLYKYIMKYYPERIEGNKFGL